MPRTGDPARVPLVGLAHVDELDLAVVDQLLRALGVDVDVRGMKGVRHGRDRGYDGQPSGYLCKLPGRWMT